MVNQADRNLTPSRNISVPHEAAVAGTRTQEPLSTRQANFKDNLIIDDLIRSLANEYENKRARQVIEWERLCRENLANTTYRTVM